MRRLIAPVFIVFLAACSNKNEKRDYTDKQQATEHVSQAASVDNVYDFSGSINNKIPVSLWYTVKDDILSGGLIYTNTKDKKAIRIIGHITTDGIFMEEYLEEGKVSGMWSGKRTGKTFSGTWAAVSSDKELNFVLQQAENKTHSTDVFATGDITGEYNYNYGESGMGSLSVKKLDDHHIIYNIQTVTASPANNLATVTDDTLELKGNEAIYKDQNEYGLCNYRLRFFKDFVVIDSPEDGYECGFGHNATVTGTFVKTGNSFTSYRED